MPDMAAKLRNLVSSMAQTATFADHQSLREFPHQLLSAAEALIKCRTRTHPSVLEERLATIQGFLGRYGVSSPDLNTFASDLDTTHSETALTEFKAWLCGDEFILAFSARVRPPSTPVARADTKPTAA